MTKIELFIIENISKMLMNLEIHFAKKSKGKLEDIANEFKKEFKKVVLEIEKEKEAKIANLEKEIEFMSKFSNGNDEAMKEIQNKKIELGILKKGDN